MAGVKIPAPAASRAKSSEHPCHINLNHLVSFAFNSTSNVVALV
jgi:hypothetical protein